MQVLLGLQRSSKSYFTRRQTTFWLDLTKPFSHRKVNRYVCSSVDCFSLRNGMDSRIATLPSLTLVLPCYVDSAKQVSVSHFVLHHFCCYFMAFCSATVPNKSLILVNESVRNSSSIDGTRLNMGFITFLSQRHTSTNVNTIARLLPGILLLCLLRTFTIFF